MPPFGRLYGIKTLVDPSLAGAAEIVCVGNARHEGVRLRFRDYEAVEEPLRLRFAVEDAPKRPEDPRRRAG